MSKTNIVGLEINESIVKDAVIETTHAAILGALSDESLSAQLVKSVLDMRVDSSGNPTKDSYRTRYSWLEYTATQAIKEEVLDVIKKSAEEMRPAIKKAVRAELMKKSTMGDLVASFVDSMIANPRYIGTSKINVEFSTGEEQ